VEIHERIAPGYYQVSLPISLLSPVNTTIWNAMKKLHSQSSMDAKVDGVDSDGVETSVGRGSSRSRKPRTPQLGKDELGLANKNWQNSCGSDDWGKAANDSNWGSTSATAEKYKLNPTSGWDGTSDISEWESPAAFPQSSPSFASRTSQGFGKAPVMDSSRQRDTNDGESIIQALDIKPGAYREVEIVSCSGSEFTVNLVENISLLEAMEAEIKASDPPPVHKGLNVGQTCVVRQPNTTSWKRGIVQAEGRLPQVFCIDTGDIVNPRMADLGVLDPKHTSLPMQAIKCSIMNAEKNELSVRGRFIAHFLSKSDTNAVWRVEMMHTKGSSGDEELPEPSHSFLNVKLSPMETVSATISWTMMQDLMSYYSGLKGIQAQERAIHVGKPVVAQYEGDEGWYRAEVIEKGPKIGLHFVDYGNWELVHETSVKRIKQEFLQLPKFAIPCKLRGIKPGTVNQDKLKQFMNGEEGTTKVTFIQEDAKGHWEVDIQVKAPVILPTSFQPSVGEELDVFISFINGVSSFYIQLNSNSDAIDSLQEKLQSSYSEGQNLVSNPEPGMTCAAQYTEDGRWYRGIVMSCSSTSAVEVFFIDYGNKELVCLLLEAHAKEAPYVIHCGLYGIQSNPQIDAKFSELADQGCFVARVRGKQDDKIQVVLTDSAKAQCVNDLLHSSTLVIPGPVAPTISGPHEECLDVYISHVESPGAFWFQTVKHEDTLNTLMSDIEAVYTGEEGEGLHVSLVTLQETYIAVYPEDGAFYRAQVTSEDQKEVKVQYIDYGNVSTITMGDMRVCKEEFSTSKISPYAKKAKLAGNQEWTDESSQIFRTFTGEGERILKMKGVEKDDIIEVSSLSDGKEDIVKTLVDKGVEQVVSLHVKPQVPKVEEGVVTDTGKEEEDHMRVYVSHVDSPTAFWFVLVHDEEPLNALKSKMDIYYNGAEGQALCVTSVSPGDFLVSLYHEDESWYRAQVLSVKDNGIEVIFVDYGNTSIVTLQEIRLCKEDFSAATIPPFAHKAGLALDPMAKEWSNDATRLLLEFVEGGEKVMILRGVEVSDTYQVSSLVDNKMDIVQSLIQKGLARLKIITPESFVGEPMSKEELEVFVSHVESPSDFWYQEVTSANRLNEIMNTIESRYSGEGNGIQIKSPVPGSHCIAIFPNDGVYYRARMLSQAADGMKVQYVDYGNTSNVPFSELYKCDEDISPDKVLPHCKHAQLALDPAIGPHWTEEATELLQELTSHGETPVKLIGYLKGNKFVVSSLKNGSLDVYDVLIQKGLANAKSEDVSCVIPLKKPSVADGSEMAVYLLHSESPDRIWLQTSDAIEKLESLSENLNQYYNVDGKAMSISCPKVGQPCAVKYSEDDCWYRGVVESLSEGSRCVRLVDFGNLEILASPNHPVILADEFFELPAQAIEAKLDGVSPPDGSGWTSSASEKLMEFAEEFQLNVHFQTVGGMLLVQAPMLVETLIQAGLAQKSKPTQSPASELLDELIDAATGGSDHVIGSIVELVLERVMSEQELPNMRTESIKRILTLSDLPSPPIFSIGDTLDVVVSHVSTPWCFCVQERGNKDLAKALFQMACEDGLFDSDDMPWLEHELLEEKLVLAVDELCAIKERKLIESHDGYFRAMILSVVEDEAKVLLIDSGAVLTVPTQDLAPLRPSCQKAPPLAIPCFLSGVQYLIDEWDPKAASALAELSKKKSIIQVLVKFPGPPYGIQICVDGSDLAQSLIKESLAKRSVFYPPFQRHHMENGGLHSQFAERAFGEAQGLIMKIFSSNFVIQFTRHHEVLEYISKELLAAHEDPDTPLYEQDFCMAYFRELDGWCRAKIHKKDGETYHVRALDHGYVEEMPRKTLSPLPDHLYDIPALGILCCLQCSEADEDGQQETLEVLSEEDGEVWFCIVGNSKHGELVVRVLQNGEREDTILGSDRHAVYKAPNLPAGEKAFAWVSHQQSPTCFWIQLKAKNSELSHLLQELREFYSQNLKCRVTVKAPGHPCVALYGESSGMEPTYFRGYVLPSNKEGMYRIHFVDYGNTTQIPKNSVYQLHPKFLEAPIYAIPCRLPLKLNDLSGTWSMDACEAFEELTGGGEKELLVEFPKVVLDMRQRVTVEMLDVGIKLSEMMVQKGYGICEHFGPLEHILGTPELKVESVNRSLRESCQDDVFVEAKEEVEDSKIGTGEVEEFVTAQETFSEFDITSEVSPLAFDLEEEEKSREEGKAVKNGAVEEGSEISKDSGLSTYRANDQEDEDDAKVEPSPQATVQNGVAIPGGTQDD
ncbi:unnamed protein product, partial [Darwinula stevensoni]